MTRRGKGRTLTNVAPFAALVFTPATSIPIPTSEPGRYLSCRWACVCCQMKSSRCSSCAFTPGQMSSVAAAERMGFVTRSPAASSDSLYGLVTVRRKWLKISCKGSCCSQVSRAVVLRPKRSVQRAVSGGRDCAARYIGYVNYLACRPYED